MNQEIRTKTWAGCFAVTFLLGLLFMTTPLGWCFAVLLLIELGAGFALLGE